MKSFRQKDRFLRLLNDEIRSVIREDKWLENIACFCCEEEGKRIRSHFLFALTQGNVSQKTIKLAVAMELFHLATLLHDDVLDGTLTRRGKIALYLKKDIPTSILFGDYLLTKSFSIVSDFGTPRMMSDFIRCSVDVLKGEMYQREKRFDLVLSKDEYLSIIRLKSGLLFGLACRIGIGSIERDDLLEQAGKFGEKIGIVYQILDDCEDILEDIFQGIVTYPIILLYQRIEEDQKKEMTSWFQSRTVFKERERIANWLRIYKIFEEVESVIDELLKTVLFYGKELNLEKAVYQSIYTKIENLYRFEGGNCNDKGELFSHRNISY